MSAYAPADLLSLAAGCGCSSFDSSVLSAGSAHRAPAAWTIQSHQSSVAGYKSKYEKNTNCAAGKRDDSEVRGRRRSQTDVKQGRPRGLLHKNHDCWSCREPSAHALKNPCEVLHSLRLEPQPVLLAVFLATPSVTHVLRRLNQPRAKRPIIAYITARSYNTSTKSAASKARRSWIFSPTPI